MTNDDARLLRAVRRRLKGMTERIAAADDSGRMIPDLRVEQLRLEREEIRRALRSLAR